MAAGFLFCGFTGQPMLGEKEAPIPLEGLMERSFGHILIPHRRQTASIVAGFYCCRIVEQASALIDEEDSSRLLTAKWNYSSKTPSSSREKNSYSGGSAPIPALILTEEDARPANLGSLSRLSNCEMKADFAAHFARAYFQKVQRGGLSSKNETVAYEYSTIQLPGYPRVNSSDVIDVMLRTSVVSKASSKGCSAKSPGGFL
jgi:hypothetical protein